MPMTGTPTWQSTNHLDLVNTDTVIKGYSSIAVTVPKATPVKEVKPCIHVLAPCCL